MMDLAKDSPNCRLAPFLYGEIGEGPLSGAPRRKTYIETRYHITKPKEACDTSLRFFLNLLNSTDPYCAF